jgi:hypothetical protein
MLIRHAKSVALDIVKVYLDLQRDTIDMVGDTQDILTIFQDILTCFQDTYRLQYRLNHIVLMSVCAHVGPDRPSRFADYTGQDRTGQRPDYRNIIQIHSGFRL